MATKTIPTSVDPFYTQRTSLEGRDYILTFYWSTRESCWYLDISTESATQIVAGLKLVCHMPLLYRIASEDRPPGEMMVISKDDLDDSPPGLNDLAEDFGRCELVYFEKNAA